MRYAQFFSFYLCAVLVGSAQTTIRADVNLVQLSVLVTDSKGRNVTGLDRGAFRLFIDHQEHPFTLFSGEDAPVTAGIVIDNSASMFPKREEVVAAAMAFARASNPRDEMFVVHFNQQARLGLPAGVPFTGDTKQLEAAISRISVGGATAMYDAILLAVAQFKQAIHGRKVLLLITDGGDNSSKASFEEVIDAVSKAGIVLYTIGIFDPNDRDRNPKVLARLAEVTGGESFLPAALADTTAICKEIAADIRRQYTLGFTGAEDGAYHQIEVIASDPKRGKLQVHTRPGYFAIAPNGSASRGTANRSSKGK